VPPKASLQGSQTAFSQSGLGFQRSVVRAIYLYLANEHGESKSLFLGLVHSFASCVVRSRLAEYPEELTTHALGSETALTTTVVLHDSLREESRSALRGVCVPRV
jgi:hypothetical protein